MPLCIPSLVEAIKSTLINNKYFEINVINQIIDLFGTLLGNKRNIVQLAGHYCKINSFWVIHDSFTSRPALPCQGLAAVYSLNNQYLTIY